MNIDNLCMNCMNEIYGEKQCSHCGYYVDSPQISPYLPLKTALGGKYIIGRVISSNSEGATYMAYDMERKTPVTVREFLPERLIERKVGETQVIVNEQWKEQYYYYLDEFLKLWRNLARVRGLSALIPVIDIIEDNNTAYAVKEYFDSISLRDFLLKSNTGYLNWEKAKIIFMPVLSTLSALHELGIVHYGINPDNLLLGRDGKLRLSGFSIPQARQEGTDFSPELSEGYTPIEQYSYGYPKGSWSDIYAFCAVLYRALVGTVPQDSLSRSANDQLLIPARYAEIIPVYVINALMNGMQIEPQERTQTVEALREELSATPGNVVSSYSGVNVPTGESAPKQEVQTASEKSDDKDIIKKTVLITFLACIGVGLLIFGGLFLYNRYKNDQPEDIPTESTKPAETFEVTDFTNQPYSMIANNPVQNERFVIKQQLEYSRDIPEGNIISQSIKEGTVVPMGTEITFVVSKGPEYVVVPESIVGEQYDLAEKILKDLGFEIEKVVKANDGTHYANTVESVSPKGGTRLIKGDKIYVQVWDEAPTEPTTEESSTSLFGKLPIWDIF